MMALLQELAGQPNFQPQNILDMGCGSGILSIMAARIWPEAVIIAADIDEAAIAATRDHIALNEVQSHITPLQSDGYRADRITHTAPYDLIMANMLAEPLVALAKDTYDHLAAPSVLLLSGILEWQAPTIQQAYNGLGLNMLEAVQIEQWQTMMWVRA